MFQNYIKIAFRNIRKYKLHAIINILGLAIAIACCLLLVLFLDHELSYDFFHENKDLIYRINSSFVRENTTIFQAKTQAPLAPVLKEEFPEIRYATRFLFTNYTVKQNDRLFTEKITFTDSDFLKIFSFDLLVGNPDEVLRRENSVIISKNIAEKYFGDINPIGKSLSIIRYGISHTFTVEGIIEDVPENSSIDYDIIIPFEKLRDFFEKEYFSNWGLFSVRTFIQLSHATDTDLTGSNISKLVKRYKNEDRSTYMLQSLADIHFASAVQETMTATSSRTYSFILAGITLLILIIANFNSINISTAIASMRYKEAGIRKILGASKRQIIVQLCSETTILVVFAFIIGVILAELFLPTFNLLAKKTLEFQYFDNIISLLLTIGFIFTIGFLSGLFPAILLSKYQPAELYHQKKLLGGKSSFSRSSIMVQFGISIFLIVCTLVMSGQLSFLKNRDLGFNQNQIVALPYRGINSKQTLNTYRTELKKYSSIINICGAYSFPAGYFHTATASTGNSSLTISQNKIDYNFLETFGIKIIEGRNFSREIASDTTGSIIINKAFVNRMGWESAIGKKMVIDWMGWEVEVIGVVEEFHYASLYERIEPLVFFLDPYVPFEYFFIRIKPENISHSLEILEGKWKETVADQPFEYFFIDEKYAQFYYSVERWNAIVTYSSILAIFIACVGLFGLTALVMVKRTKEIGIRKVVGASVHNIVLMLSSEFTKWILLANIIAWPTSYYVMDLWLHNFAYKIDMNWWIFIFAGCFGLAIAITVIGFQAIKSAVTNPVESLRYE